MHAQRLVGLHGRARSGKDTVAQLLADKHDFARLTFASPIKDALLLMFGLRREDFEGAAKEATIDWLDVSPRHLMQTLGTEWGRKHVADDVLIRHAARRLAHIQRYARRVVISDVRFENEAQWIRSHGGEIWHIKRRETAGAVRSHTSEAGIDFRPEDSILVNDGTLAELAEWVQLGFKGLLAGEPAENREKSNVHI
jgi:hypothetical protein